MALGPLYPALGGMALGPLHSGGGMALGPLYSHRGMAHGPLDAVFLVPVNWRPSGCRLVVTVMWPSVGVFGRVNGFSLEQVAVGMMSFFVVGDIPILPFAGCLGTVRVVRHGVVHHGVLVCYGALGVVIFVEVTFWGTCHHLVRHGGTVLCSLDHGVWVPFSC